MRFCDIIIVLERLAIAIPHRTLVTIVTIVLFYNIATLRNRNKKTNK